MQLRERDKRILALIGTDVRPISDLAVALDSQSETLEDRLSALADMGLVDDRGDGCYERTESGRRVLVTSADGAIDERIDTSPEIERAIEEFDLRVDEADAVRHAFTFLQYWGRATEEEIVDAIYSEVAAGRETSEEWWEQLVSGPLASLPGVAQPTEDGDPWRYTGTPEVDRRFTDGRRVLSRLHPAYGDVKYGLESLDFTETEREAASAAFTYLFHRGEVTEQDLADAVYPDHSAGYTSPQSWWDGVIRDAFEALPNVERIGERRWRYRKI